MDNEYYLLDAGTKTGPFSAQELMDRPLEPNDVVLLPMQAQGTEAYLLPEFKEYFKSEGIYHPTPENTRSYFLRLPAYVIDAIIVVFCTTILGLIFFPGYMHYLQGIFAPSLLTDPDIQNVLIKHQTELLILQSTVFVITVLYNALCESSRLRASIGKYILGLAVVDELGYSLTFGQALKRNAGKLIYELTSWFIGFLAYLAYFRIFFSYCHQGIHDKMAGCFIVKKNA